MANARIAEPPNIGLHAQRWFSAAGCREGGQERRTQVSPERRLEFEGVLSRNLPGFQRAAMRSLLSLDQPAQDDQQTIADLVADQRPTPEKTLEGCEQLKLVVKLTRSLPPSERVAMQLRQKDDGLSVREAAEVLGVPVGTLKAQFARGQATVRKQLRWSNATAKGKGVESICHRRAEAIEVRPRRSGQA